MMKKEILLALAAATAVLIAPSSAGADGNSSPFQPNDGHQDCSLFVRSSTKYFDDGASYKAECFEFSGSGDSTSEVRVGVRCTFGTTQRVWGPWTPAFDIAQVSCGSGNPASDAWMQGR